MGREVVLVTGATGLIGSAIAKRLAAGGRRVRALVRNAERASELLPAEVELLTGDVTEPASLAAAMADVDLVFHAAGMPEQWQPDDAVFDRVNRQGTINVLAAARDAKVRRVVSTRRRLHRRAPRRRGEGRERRAIPRRRHARLERDAREDSRPVSSASFSGT